MNDGSVSRRRNSNRLQGYDYSLPGAYFVTLVAKDRQPLFGELAGERVVLNRVGRIVREEWDVTARMRREIRIDQSVVMPNHFHAIVFIDDLRSGEQNEQGEAVGAHGRAPLHRRPRSLGSLVAAYKAATTRRIRDMTKNPDLVVWQRNYYDRIVRNQTELDSIREYILYNPLKLLEGW